MGFREHSGSYGLFGMTLTGAFISDRPLGPAEGCRGDPDFGDPVLVLEIPEHELDPDTELQQEGLGYREWCISAKLANRYILGVITEP